MLCEFKSEIKETGIETGIEWVNGNDYENVQQRLYSCSDRGCG